MQKNRCGEDVVQISTSTSLPYDVAHVITKYIPLCKCICGCTILGCVSRYCTDLLSKCCNQLHCENWSRECGRCKIIGCTTCIKMCSTPGCGAMRCDFCDVCCPSCKRVICGFECQVIMCLECHFATCVGCKQQQECCKLYSSARAAQFQKSSSVRKISPCLAAAYKNTKTNHHKRRKKRT